MTLRELPSNPTSQMLALYAVSLGALGVAPLLVRCAARAMTPGATRAAASPAAVGPVAEWACAHSASLFVVLALASLAALVLTVLRARSREANIRGLAVLSVLNCLFSVALMGLVLMGLLQR